MRLVTPVNQASCQGFSLIEVLIAMLILAMAMAAMMRYQQQLLYQLHYSEQSQQALKLATQLLDIYPADLPLASGNWYYHYHVLDSFGMFAQCQTIKATVTSPLGVKAEQQRFICRD